MNGIDYSWARPGGAAIKAAGFDFAMRYVPYPGDGGKGLTTAELADLQANGLSVGLVFESTGDRMKEGEQAGREDAATCLAAQMALGWPNDRPFYFAVDWDARSQNDLTQIDAYLRGAASVLGAERVGVYGGYYVLDHCAKAQTARWYWQTYAWSQGQVHPLNHIYQYENGQTLNGGAVDYCTAIDGDFGQWPVTTASSGDQTSETGGEEMNTKEQLLGGIACGDYQRMLSAYSALRQRGTLPDLGLDNVENDTPDDTMAVLNAALVKRFSILELAFTNADAADAL